MSNNAGSINAELNLMIDRYRQNWRTGADLARQGSRQIEQTVRQANTIASDGVSRLSTNISALGGRITSVSSSLGLLPGSLGSVAARMSSLGSVASANATSLASLASSIGIVGSGGTAAAGGVGAFAASLAAVAPVAIAAAAAVAGFGIAQAALKSEPVRLFADMEKTEAAFATMLGSMDRAKDLLAELGDFSKSTPFDFPEIAQTARSLLNVGVSASEVESRLQLLGDVASGAQTDLTGLAMIYTQAISNQKVEWEDIRQLANRNLPIFAALQKSLNVTGAELRQMSADGKIGFAELHAALLTMTAEGGIYFEAMKNQAGLLDQLLSAQADTWRALKIEIGKVVTENLDLKGVVTDTIEFIENAGPLIVDAFDMGTRMLAPFVQLFRELMKLAGEIMEPFGEMNDMMDDAFGDETASMLKDIAALMTPVVGAVKLAAEAVGLIVDGLKYIKESAQTVADNVVAAVTPGVTAQDMADQRKGEIESKAKQDGLFKEFPNELSRRRAAAAASASGSSPAAGATASSGRSGGGGGGSGSGRSSADREEDLRVENEVQRLRAAGREEEAEKLALLHKMRKELAKAESDTQRALISVQRDQQLAAIEDKFARERQLESERTAADKKREDERAAERVAAIEAETRISQLRREGHDLEADIEEIRQRLAREMADATSNRERESLAARAREQEAVARAKDAEQRAREAARDGSSQTTSEVVGIDPNRGRTLGQIARDVLDADEMNTIRRGPLRGRDPNASITTMLGESDMARRGRIASTSIAQLARENGLQGQFRRATNAALNRVAQARSDAASSEIGAGGVSRNSPVNVTANIGANELADAIVTKAGPLFTTLAQQAAEKSVERLRQEVHAHRYAQGVRRNL